MKLLILVYAYVCLGGGLWSTGLAMAKYFQIHSEAVRNNLQRLQSSSCSNNIDDDDSAKKKKISAIELGSGNGFLSICLAALAPDIIDILAITDLDDHLELMNQTVNANSHILSNCNSVKHNQQQDNIADEEIQTSKVQNLVKSIVMEHRWGEFDNNNNNNDDDTSKLDELSSSLLTIEQKVQNGSKTFDFIFGSDIAYREYGYHPLIASFQRLFHENSVGLVGITMVDTRPKFFHLLREAGFRYDRLSDHLMEPEFRNNTFGLFVIRRSKS